MHFRRDGFEKNANFLSAVENSRYRKLYLDDGLYAGLLQNYYDVFPNGQIHIMIYDDFRQDQAAEMRRLLRFLGVDENVALAVDGERNVSGLPQGRALKLFLRIFARPEIRARARAVLPHGVRERSNALLHRWMEKDLKRVPLAASERRIVSDHFRHDIDKLSVMLGRDLRCWLGVLE